MDLNRKVKTALDESRMLILGVQILVGFQFRSAFQTAYEQLPDWSRGLLGLALLLLIATVGLLILPGSFHRLVEDGNASGRFQQLANRVMYLALAPFALSLGIDVAVVGERLLGATGGIAVGAAVGLLALFCWYWLEQLKKRSHGKRERTMTDRQRDKREQTPLPEKINQMLTEARVILPGAQALLGFQLAIVLTESFEKLPDAVRLLHGVALLSVATSVVLLMAPAAIHRIVYAGEDTDEFHRSASRFVTASTVPLALGIAIDVYVVGTKIAQAAVAATAAGAILALLLGLWHALPLIARGRRRRRAR